MATYTNWNSLKAGLQKELRAAMEDALDLSKEAVYTETQVFYTGGEPNSYVRTGAFGESAERTEVQGSGDSLAGEVWMNGNYTYGTGSPRKQKIERIEKGRPVCRPAFWVVS